jgi:hypothetical protein
MSINQKKTLEIQLWIDKKALNVRQELNEELAKKIWGITSLDEHFN